MKAHIRHLFILFFATTLGFGNQAFAENKKVFEKSDFKNLDFHKTQQLRQEMIWFFSEIEKTTKHEIPKTVLNKMLNNILFNGSVYAADEACFFGGWPSQMIEGVCKTPWSHGRQTSYSDSYSSCANGQFRCNPILTGEDNCVDVSTEGYGGLTNKCSEKTTPEQLKKIIANLKGDDGAKLKALAEEINQFCQSVDKTYNRPDHKNTCQALSQRIDEIEKEELSAQKAKPLETVASAVANNKSMAIINSCKEKYDSENKGFMNSMVKSNRGIFDQILAVDSDCVKDRSLIYPGKSLAELDKSLEDIGGRVEKNNMLDYFNRQSTENGVDAYLSHVAMYEGEDKNSKSYKDQYPEIAARVGNKKLKKITPKDITEKYSKFGGELNQICQDIGSKTIKDIGKPYVGRQESVKPGEKSKAQIYNEGVQKYITEANTTLYNSLIKFTQENKEIAPLLYSDTYKDLFDFNAKLGEKCAKGHIRLVADIDEVNDEGNAKDAISEIKKTISDDLKLTAESVTALKGGNKDKIEDQIDEMLKYRPYLAGNFLKGLKSEEEKELYAKYICQRTFDIYGSDKLWNTGALVAGTIVGVAAGLATGGLGAGIGASLIAGGVVAGAEGAYIFTKEMGEANRIVSGATVAVINEQISDQEFRDKDLLASDRKLNAVMAAGGALAAPVGHVIAPLAKAGKNAAVLSTKAGKTAAAQKALKAKVARNVAAKKFSDAEVNEIASLSDAGRMNRLMGDYPELKELQYDAVMVAHNKVPCKVRKCTPDELAQKRQILKDAGIENPLRGELIRRGFAGFPDKKIVPSSDSKKFFSSSTGPVANGAVAKTDWTDTLTNHRINMDQRIKITAEKQSPDGIIEEITFEAHYAGRENGNIVFRDGYGNTVINPNDPNIRITRMSTKHSTIEDVKTYDQKIEIPFYEADPTRVAKALNKQEVSLKYIDEDGETFDIVGKIIQKDGKTFIQKKYSTGQTVDIDFDKLNIQAIERNYQASTWKPGATHPRELEDKFTKGATVEVNYKPTQSAYSSTAAKDTIVTGKYVGVTDDYQQVVIRDSQNGDLKYISIKELNELKIPTNGSIVEFNGGNLNPF